MAVTQLLEPLMDTLEGIRMPTRFKPCEGLAERSRDSRHSWERFRERRLHVVLNGWRTEVC